MQKIIRNALNIFIIITATTAILALVGIGGLWISGKSDLPYLKLLITSVLLEIVGVIITFTTKGRKYLPEVVVTKNVNETMDFMIKFFKDASSISIVSNRVSWLASNNEIKEDIIVKSNSDIRIEIITPNNLDSQLMTELSKTKFYVTKEKTPPYARFTLINGDRGGCERLAIARGSYPDHEITVFDSYSGPQMISMAKDIIRKNKEQSNA